MHSINSFFDETEKQLYNLFSLHRLEVGEEEYFKKWADYRYLKGGMRYLSFNCFRGSSLQIFTYDCLEKSFKISLGKNA